MAEVRRIGSDVYRVTGIVLSARKNPIPNAGVRITDVHTSTEIPTYSDEFLKTVNTRPIFANGHGVFSFFIPVGQYRLSYSGADDFHVPEEVVLAGQHSRHEIRKSGTRVGLRRATNLVQGGGIAIDAVDDPENDEVDITVTATAGAGFGAPTGEIDIGDVNQEGVAAASTRTDHQHSFPGPSAGETMVVDPATSAEGTSTKPARADHKHRALHTDLGGVAADQHHAQVHGITSADHTGSLPHADLSGISADQHHATNHSDTQHTDGPNFKPSEIGWFRKVNLVNQTSTPAAATFVEVAFIAADVLLVQQVRAIIKGSLSTNAIGRIRLTEEDSVGNLTEVDVTSAATGATDRFYNAVFFRPTNGDIFQAQSWATVEAQQALALSRTDGKRLVRVALWIQCDNVTDPITWTFQAIACELRA